MQSNLNNLDARLKNGIIRYFTEKQNMLTGLARGIPNLSQILQEATQKFDDRIERLHNAFTNFIKTKSGQIEICGLKPFYIKNIVEKKSEFLNNLSLRLSAVSVDAVLKRGFAWVKGDKGQTIYNVAEAKQADNLEIRFVDGHLNTRNISNTMLSNTKQPKKGNKNNEKQISLFDL